MNSTRQLTFTDDDLIASIPERFYQVLQQLPADHLAYVATDESLTYQELAAASQGLALALIAHLGKATEPSQQQAVALLLPHHSMALIGIYGTIFAGHFYFPLDFLLGEPMLRQILADCPPKALVTTTALRDRMTALLPADHNLPILCVDTIPWAAMPLPTPQPCDPQMYASVQYTSGSTGKPRGVIRTHATNLYSSYLACHDLGFTSCDRASHLFSYAHAFSTSSIFGGLLNGATLHARTLTEISPLVLYQWIGERQITALAASIGLLRSLAELSATHPPLLSLRSIGTGGEVMTHVDVDRLCQLLPPACRLVIRLASTEAGTYARFIIEAGKPWQGERTPAGYAPYGQEVMILDEQHQPVAADQSGEIAVRSRFVCAGYWNRPAENAAKFLPSPTVGQPPLFLTGDRGRMAADGLLEHLGRIDFMVKIRGFRVEPETIEQALMTHPALYECVVVARPSRSGESRLIAYLVARSVPGPSVSELRELLTQSLPDYMIPARFVYLQTLPRNANGKLQRQALPAPGAHRPDLAIPFVAPHNEVEQKLADMWAELLELDEIGMEDNFFELGGDSLTAMRIVFKVNEQYGRSLSLGFFHNPTVTGLAQLISGKVTMDESAQPAMKEVPPHPSSRGEARRLSPRRFIQHKMMNTGPLWREHALPYGVGVRLQQQWIKLPRIKQAFQKRSTVLQEWLTLLGRKDPNNQEQELSILANTWRTWRDRSIQQPETFAKWVTSHNADILESILATKRPVILVGTHTAIHNMAARIAIQQRSDRTIWTLSYSPSGDVDAISKVIKARELLIRGGLVLVTGDGEQGTKGIELPFCGSSWLFRTGGAELALETDAILLPVFNTLARTGHIEVEFLKPLATSVQTKQGQIEDLTRQYATLLETRWPSLISNMKWGKLRHIMDYSPKGIK